MLILIYMNKKYFFFLKTEFQNSIQELSIFAKKKKKVLRMSPGDEFRLENKWKLI